MTTPYHYLVGRLCYTGSIFTPFVPQGEPEDRARWGLSLLIDKGDAQSDAAFAAYKKDILDTGKSKWGERAVAGGRPTFEVAALKDGDAEEHAFMDGYWVVKAQTKFGEPKVLAPDNNPIVAGSPEADQLIYDGQNIMLRVKLTAWTYMKREGVSAGLQGIKILGGGKREEFGGGGNVENDLAAHTPADLPPSMKAASAEQRTADEQALGGGDNTEPMTAKEDIPW